MTRHHLRSSTRKPTGTAVEGLAAEKIEPTCESAGALTSAPLATKAGSAASLTPARIRGTPLTQVTNTAKVMTEPSTGRKGTHDATRPLSRDDENGAIRPSTTARSRRTRSAVRAAMAPASQVGNPFPGRRRILGELVWILGELVTACRRTSASSPTCRH